MPNSQVKDYFDSYATGFDSIYHHKKSLGGRLVDLLFRRGMEARFRYIISHARVEDGTSILDVGCGSGRYILPLARKGGQVTGIDFSFPMLKLARSLVEQAGCGSRCRFICAEFSSLPIIKSDVVIAVGLFDYLSDPKLWLRLIQESCRREAWITFPKKHEFKAPLRRIRLNMKRCPLYLYSYLELKSLAEDLNTSYEIIKEIEGDFILHFWRN